MLGLIFHQINSLPTRSTLGKWILGPTLLCHADVPDHYDGLHPGHNAYFQWNPKWTCGTAQEPKGCIALMAIVSMGLAWINWGLSIVGLPCSCGSWQRSRRRGLSAPRSDRLSGSRNVLAFRAVGFSPSSRGHSKALSRKRHRDHSITQTIFHPSTCFSLRWFSSFSPSSGHDAPKEGDEVEADPNLIKEASFESPAKPVPAQLTPALKLEHSPIINLIVGIAGIIWLIWYFNEKGFAGINLDVVNFIFIIAGVLLTGRRPPSSSRFRRGHVHLGSGGSISFLRRHLRDHPVLGIGRGHGELVHGDCNQVDLSFCRHVVFGILNYIVPSGGPSGRLRRPTSWRLRRTWESAHR